MINTKKTLFISFVLLIINGLSYGQGYFEVDNLSANDKAKNDRIGYSADHDSGNAIFGAINQNKDSDDLNNVKYARAAHIFSTVGGAQKISTSDRSAFDRFGFSVAIEGDYAVDGLSSSGVASNRKAYVFKKNPLGIWDEYQIVTPSEALTLFGYSVAISDGIKLYT